MGKGPKHVYFCIPSVMELIDKICQEDDKLWSDKCLLYLDIQKLLPVIKQRKEKERKRH